ncbi:DUF2268 domain-containing protein [Bacillus sp. MRMR6]|uniref:DUF2268 domain-containing protein n=1 Tax=Bacillus sp. MRMR6 TaxID=1928617 RepID=UPI000951E0D5|nr:DUF2268 domain-containing protein [Bacillus sp. MRMR6]OLS33714.1 Zn-dependent protease [Bacillus sp. MRMR6]
MSVIRTDRWLNDLYHQPIEICEKLRGYFGDAQAFEIYDYLSMYGMYSPMESGKVIVNELQRKKVWDTIHTEKKLLQKNWAGPSVPIFIFPSDTENPMIKQNFNGKSGLSFCDKLFLFLSADNGEKEIRSLFTHEYNHVCRLVHFQKKEEDYVLLDTIILEGLAEFAVNVRFGEEYTASWTSYYSDVELESIWNRIISPNKDLSKFDPRHQDLLFGLRRYPKMSGYCVGYYLVKKYIENNNQLKIKDLLKIDSAIIAKIDSKI